MLNPTGCLLPKAGNGPLGAKTSSSGLDQGTRFFDSATMMVFEVPSVISRIGTPLSFKHRVRADDDLIVGQGGVARWLARTAVDCGHAREQGLVVGAVPGLVEVKLVEEGLFPNQGQDRDPPAQERLAVLVHDRGRREVAMRGTGDVVMHRQGDLLEIVHTLRPLGCLHGLHGRHESAARQGFPTADDAHDDARDRHALAREPAAAGADVAEARARK